jgi:heat shock protein HtpX
MAVFFGVVIGIGWIFSQIYGNPGILYIAVGFSISMNILSYWFSHKIVLALHRAKPVDLKEHPELYRVLENLTIAAGLPMPKFYLIEDPAPNAFATGRNPKNAVVCVTTGLIERLDRSELEGVLAHELSHIGNRDMLVSTVAVVLVGFVAILSDMFMRSMWYGGGSDDDRGKAGGILIIVGIILSILAPIIASLIHLAISRKREFLADASGALLTRYPEGLASALQKISTYSRPMKTATNATAHLFLENPFGADHDRRRGERKTPWVVKIFSTHPPVEERVRALIGKK